MAEEFIKLLLIGDSGVGKSCVLTRFCQDKFIEAFYNTIGVDFKTKMMKIDGKKCKLQIWDTAGQQRFRTITANYYKGAHGILIVFDLTSKESLKNIQFWLSQIQKHANSKASMILIGNKCDLYEKRQVSEDQANKFASSHKLQYIEVSAFNAANVELVFETISKSVLRNKHKQQQAIKDKQTPPGNTSKLSKKDSNKAQKQKKSCC